MFPRLILFILLSSLLLSQPEKVTEIENRLRSFTGKDRLPLLFQINALPFNQNGEKYLSIGREIVEIARSINDTLSVVRGLQIKAKGYTALDEHEKALDLYFQSRELAIEIKDIPGEAKANSEIGNLLYFAFNSFLKATEYYQKAENLHAQLQDDFGVAKHQNNRADILVKIGRYLQAVELYASALKQLEKSPRRHRSSQAVILGNLAFSCANLGNMETAWHYHNRMGTINSEINDPKRHVQWLHNRANLFETAGQYDKALAALEAAQRQQTPFLEKESKLARLRYEFSALNHTFRIFLKMGDLKSAEKLLEKATLSYERDLDHYTNANFQINRARFFKAKGELSTAIAIAKANADKCKAHQFLLELKECYRDLSLWCQDAGDTDSALSFTRELIDIDREALRPTISADIMAILMKYEEGRFNQEFRELEHLRIRAWLLSALIGLCATFLTLIFLKRYKKRNLLRLEQVEMKHAEEIRSMLDWLTDLKKKADSQGPPFIETENLVKKLIMVIQDEELFRDSDLTLERLAEKLGTNRNTLSHAVNTCWGDNINDFINFFRVKEAKSLLLDRKSVRRIITIAFEVGFNSMANFNRVFKEKTGLTPKQYRQLKRMQ